MMTHSIIVLFGSPWFCFLKTSCGEVKQNCVLCVFCAYARAIFSPPKFVIQVASRCLQAVPILLGDDLGCLKICARLCTKHRAFLIRGKLALCCLQGHTKTSKEPLCKLSEGPTDAVSGSSWI